MVMRVARTSLTFETALSRGVSFIAAHPLCRQSSAGRFRSLDRAKGPRPGKVCRDELTKSLLGKGGHLGHKGLVRPPASFRERGLVELCH
jgi:hypothetical protein